MNEPKSSVQPQPNSVNPTTYKNLPGHPGYRVGDDGTVWTCLKRGHTLGVFGSRYVIGDEWRQLKTFQEKCGGLSLTIGNKTMRVHRLVLEAFVGPCPPGMEACHFPDRDRTNNNLSNLRWDTTLANMRDKIKHGTTQRGIENPQCKLTEEKVLKIREELASGVKRKVDLAKEYGVSRHLLWCIHKRKCWKHLKP